MKINKVYHIIAYCVKNEIHVDLYYNSINEARARNPNLKDFVVKSSWSEY